MNKKQRDSINNLINKFEEDVKKLLGNNYDFSLRSECTQQINYDISRLKVSFLINKKLNEEEK